MKKPYKVNDATGKKDKDYIKNDRGEFVLKCCKKPEVRLFKVCPYCGKDIK